MPIYEYGCRACGTKQERFERRMSVLSPPACKVCGAVTEKLISVVSFDLRGSGFYENDYGNGAHKLKQKDQQRRALRDLIAAGNTVSRHVHDALAGDRCMDSKEGQAEIERGRD